MLDNETKNILSLCSTSTQVLAKTFFPERFYLPFNSSIHGEIFRLLDSPAQKVAIAAPRGWGKTSIVALAFMARWILFNLSDFIVYINKSHDAASLQTENLRRELVSNNIIRQFFGKVKPEKLEGDFEEVFSKKSWVAFNSLVWPRGAEQIVRGVLFKNSRPGLIVLDDIEDPFKVENEEIRTRWYSWLYADVIKALPRTGPIAKRTKIVYIDTLKHEDSVLQKLLDSPEWESIRLEACDDDFNPTAPDFMSKEDILKEWLQHQEAGQTDVFFRELRNLPISTKDATFQRGYFNYYNPLPDESLGTNSISLNDIDIQLSDHIETVIIADPAKTVKMHSAESAVVAVGIDMTNARLFIRDVISEKLYPDELYNEIFNMAQRTGAHVIGVEETSLNEFIRQPLKNEMFRRGIFYELIWLKPRGGVKKEERIKQLAPYYRHGYVYHNRQCETIFRRQPPGLEHQLLMFPRSALFDIMDCLAYIIEMLELGERYFSTELGEQAIEAEYQELTYEPPLENWRRI